MAVDSNIGSLPAAASIEDDSLLVAEQQGEAKHFTGKQLKDYAKQGVDALVQAAQKAAEDAAQAARDAKAAADSVQDVSADAAAAKAAARAATQAMLAADNARLAAEAAAGTAAANVENRLKQYVSDAQSAKGAAEQAAGNAAAGVENALKDYVSDAESAKNAAEQAAENAAAEAVRQAESKLSGYVTDAENAKSAAQSAAGTAATDAANAVNSQLAQHVADAQAAQKAAEEARDQAQAIAGGDFLPLAGGKMTGAIKLHGNPTEDLHAVPKQYVDDTLGYVEGELIEVNGGSSSEDPDTGNDTGGSGGTSYRIGHGLKVDGSTLMVDSVSNFDGDNTLPATASLVQSTVGNIEVLLATI